MLQAESFKLRTVFPSSTTNWQTPRIQHACFNNENVILNYNNNTGAGTLALRCHHSVKIKALINVSFICNINYDIQHDLFPISALYAKQLVQIILKEKSVLIKRIYIHLTGELQANKAHIAESVVKKIIYFSDLAPHPFNPVR